MEIICPKCNRSANVDDTFAGKSVKCVCGERFIASSIKESLPKSVQVQEAVTSSPIRKSMECPHCGYVMDAFTVECPRCKIYESAGTKPGQYKQSPQPEKNESPRKTQFRCQQCGEQLPEGALDCPICSPRVKAHEAYEDNTPISPHRPMVSIVQSEPASSSIGKHCPFCQTPIKPGVEVMICNTCGMPHHLECWQENHGCTTLGCQSNSAEANPVMDNHNTTHWANRHNHADERVELPRQRTNWMPAYIAALCLLLLVIGIALTYVRHHYLSQGSLQGQIFIVTNGRDNIKLGLVTVKLYNYDDISSYLVKRKTEYGELVNKEKQLVDTAKAAANNAKQSADNAEQNENNTLNAYTAAPYDDPNQSSLEAANQQAQDESNQASEAYRSADESYREAINQSKDALAGSFFFENLPTPNQTTQTDADGKFTFEIPENGQYVVAAQAQRDVIDSTEYYYWMIQVSLNGASSKSMMLSNDNLSNAQSPDSLIDTVY